MRVVDPKTSGSVMCRRPNSLGENLVQKFASEYTSCKTLINQCSQFSFKMTRKRIFVSYIRDTCMTKNRFYTSFTLRRFFDMEIVR